MSPTLNVANILKVADAIEAACAPDAKPEIGFNMGRYETDYFSDLTGHDCGTVCCIAGWAIRVVDGVSWFAHENPISRSHEILGTEIDFGLFAPDGYEFGDITPQHAVAVLRHLAATGEVDWTVGAPSSEVASDV